MNTPSSSIQDMSRRLLAAEAAGGSTGETRMDAAAGVFEKLRISLTRFAGAEGFSSLLRRALTLARTEVPGLHGVALNADGTIEGLEEITAFAGNGGHEPAVAIIAHLLALLVTFIGEPLTLRLLREAWPDAQMDE